MKCLILDHDGVISLGHQEGTRKNRTYRGKLKSKFKKRPDIVNYFDDVDYKAVEVVNDIITKTDCEIVVSSDWRADCSISKMGELYEYYGFLKKPIDYTPFLASNEITIHHIQHIYEQIRAAEIQAWIDRHPEVTHWVAVDDMRLEKNENWGLDNFVCTPRFLEGIKQSGVKEKILSYLE